MYTDNPLLTPLLRIYFPSPRIWVDTVTGFSHRLNCGRSDPVSPPRVDLKPLEASAFTS